MPRERLSPQGLARLARLACLAIVAAPLPALAQDAAAPGTEPVHPNPCVAMVKEQPVVRSTTPVEGPIAAMRDQCLNDLARADQAGRSAIFVALFQRLNHLFTPPDDLLALRGDWSELDRHRIGTLGYVADFLGPREEHPGRDALLRHFERSEALGDADSLVWLGRITVRLWLGADRIDDAALVNETLLRVVTPDGPFESVYPQILKTRALIASKRGDTATNIAVLEQIRALLAGQADTDRVRRARAGTLNSLGNVYADLNSLERALAFYEEGAALLRGRPDVDPNRFMQSTLEVNIGTTHRLSGDPARGIPNLERAVALIENSVEGGAGDAPSAIAMRALAFRRYELARSREEIGEPGALDEAEAALDAMVAHRRPSEAASAIVWVAERRQLRGENARALALLERADALVEEIGAPEALTEREADTYFVLDYAKTKARVLQGLGREAEALRYADAALRLSEGRFDREKMEAASNADLLFRLRDKEAESELARQEARLAAQEAELAARTAQIAEQRARIAGQQTEVAEQKAARSRLVAVVTASGLSVALLVAYLAWRAWHAQRALAASRQLFLREMHHRVGNNMQVLSSLVRMAKRDRSRLRENPEAAMGRVQHRIQTMAAAHDELRYDEQGQDTEVVAYLRGLLDLLRRSLGRPSVTLNADLSGGVIPSDLVVPVGLVVTELVSNAYEHAFPDGADGTILVRTRTDADALTLLVRDDGRGVRRTDEARSLGLGIVRDLAAQASGTITRRVPPGGGTEWVFTAPLREGPRTAPASRTGETLGSDLQPA